MPQSNQSIYQSTFRAEELIAQAVEIWSKSGHTDSLEGLENDPVFAMLISALAYQTTRLDQRISSLEADIAAELKAMTEPFGLTHAMPATAAVALSLPSSVGSVELNENVEFTLGQEKYRFRPLLRTTLFNIAVGPVVRLDGRRWKVSVRTDHSLQNLKGLTFTVTGAYYRSLTVTVDGRRLPLARPWQYVNLPFCRCFSISQSLYGGVQTLDVSTLSFDLYARQNTALFCVGNFPLTFGQTEAKSLELVFEFEGIPEDFVFDKTHLELNAAILANVGIENASLSSTTPVHRVNRGQFLYMLRPDGEAPTAQSPVTVRRVDADRFNKGALLGQLETLRSRFDTDYHAFLSSSDKNSSALIAQFRTMLSRMIERLEGGEQHAQGVYLILSNSSRTQSTGVNYLVTDGAAVNKALNDAPVFTCQNAVINPTDRLLAKPVAGRDELSGKEQLGRAAKYFTVTHDRLVTPADILAFCRYELSASHGVDPDMIDDIVIDHRLSARDPRRVVIAVDIAINENPYIKRKVTPVKASLERMIQRKIEVRSANIYPIEVNITIL